MGGGYEGNGDYLDVMQLQRLPISLIFTNKSITRCDKPCDSSILRSEDCRLYINDGLSSEASLLQDHCTTQATMNRLRSFLQRRRSSRTGADPQQAPAGQQPLQQQQQPPPLQQKALQSAQVPLATTSATTTGQLTIALQNQTNSNTVFAYVTGRAIDNGNAWFLLRSDAVTPYFPASPGQIMQPLGADVAIRLGGPGSTIQAQIPRIAGGRIWFSIDQPIEFKLNPGPALVEPSVTNPSDPNAQVNWGFAEFTFNSDQCKLDECFVGASDLLTLFSVC